MSPGSRELYVRVDVSGSPVLNLASARLIAATSITATGVQSELGHTKRGPLLGIQVLQLPRPAAGAESACVGDLR